MGKVKGKKPKYNTLWKRAWAARRAKARGERAVEEELAMKKGCISEVPSLIYRKGGVSADTKTGVICPNCVTKRPDYDTLSRS